MLRHSVGLKHRLGATKHRADPGQQLARSKGLGQVVVGAEVEGPHLVLFVTSRTDDDDRSYPLALEVLQYLPAVHERQTDVEEDDLATRGREDVDRRRP